MISGLRVASWEGSLHEFLTKWHCALFGGIEMSEAQQCSISDFTGST